MEVRWRKGPGNEVVEHLHLLEKFKGKVKMGTLLSERDQRILESIFNPNLTFGNEIQADEATEELISNGHEETAAEKKAKELEILAVENAEQGNVDVALNHLNEAVECCPNSASVYNNRAQVLLLKGEKDLASLDLDKALDLCGSKGQVAGQAFTQRALIHKLNGDNDAALEDFKKAARLGNSFAKSQVAEMNPYAALCNQMLTEAISKLRESDQS